MGVSSLTPQVMAKDTGLSSVSLLYVVDVEIVVEGGLLNGKENTEEEKNVPLHFGDTNFS